MNGVIYCYTSPSGKQYIGQTINEKRRKADHKRAYGTCGLFRLAVLKYGMDNIKYEVLHKNIESIELLNFLEQKEIRERNTISPNGYNLDSGGKNCLKCESTKMAIAKKATGRQITEETREKLRESHLGISPSEEAREKVSKALKGIKRSDDFKEKMKKIRNSEEAKEKTSKVHLGRKRSQETKDRISEAIKKHWETRKNASC